MLAGYKEVATSQNVHLTRQTSDLLDLFTLNLFVRSERDSFKHLWTLGAAYWSAFGDNDGSATA